MSRRRPRRKSSPPRGSHPDRLGTKDRVVVSRDGEWVVRQVTGAAASREYRCPGCEQLVRRATPHLVVWPVAGSTLSGGGLPERRHWHTGCWQREERRTGGV